MTSNRRSPTHPSAGEPQAPAEASLKLYGRPLPTCEEYVDTYLTDYARRNKASSLYAQTNRLQPFRDHFGKRRLDLSRAELKEWANGKGRSSQRGPVPGCQLEAIISLYNHAIDEEDLPLPRNPARRLARRSLGRAAEAPPSQDEFLRLLSACSALGSYRLRMRALLLFAAYTLMRPGELFALEWGDIDFSAMRIRKLRRLYRGQLAVPKTGPKLIALTPPARDALMTLPRDSKLVFTSKKGRRLSTETLWEYWQQVLDASGLQFDFYQATKHYGVHHMWTRMKLSPRAIAVQAGWRLETAIKMLGVYGHADFGALEEIDAAFPESAHAFHFPGQDVAARLDSWQPSGSRARSRAAREECPSAPTGAES